MFTRVHPWGDWRVSSTQHWGLRAAWVVLVLSFLLLQCWVVIGREETPWGQTVPLPLAELWDETGQ